MLEELIKNYIQELQLTGKSPMTVESYQCHLAKFARFCEENNYDFRTVNGNESRAFRNWLVDQGFKPASVNAIISAVKSFYDFLVEEEEVKGNPIITKRLHVIEEKGLPAFLTEAEEGEVLAYLQKLPYHVALAFRTMLACGLQVSEAAGLEPEDVLIQQGGVFVAVKHGKGNKGRMVPVTDAGVAHELLAFAQTKTKNEKLFGVTAGTLVWYAREIRLATGVDFRTHRLQHTLATRLLSEGTPLDVVQEVLGHENINTTRRYAKTAPEKIYQLTAKIGQK